MFFKNAIELLLSFAVFLFVCSSSDAYNWTLSNYQHRLFLQFYAPLLFKRVDESSSRRGYDWVTNFDFDNDKDFSNNKENWEELNSFIDGSDYHDWKIRPTLYCAMLEYMAPDGRRKDATLLYHVYHAKQDRSIHDWERIEVRLTGITGNPGSGELVSYVVVTEHSDHKIRRRGHEDLNFMTTAHGKHVMIWQAEQTKPSGLFGWGGFYGGELHFVEDSFETILRRIDDDNRAEVEVNGDSEKKNFHYLFVPQYDPSARAYWKSLTLTQSNAFDLQTGEGRGQISFTEARKINYELQDLADIFPTHWEGGFYARHWKSDKFRRVYMEEPLRGGIDGGPSVPTGLQIFNVRAIDDEDSGEDRNGYPSKSWFWGYYDLSGETVTENVYDDPHRIAANGDPNGATGNYFRQHDYYVHDGPSGVGRWLLKGWNRAENGGFDGRWIQLFQG